MTTIEVVYLISSSSSLVMGLAQVRQIILTKRSDELNIGTWVMWLISQGIFLTYVSTRPDPVLITMQWIWLLFYIAMVVLVVYYRLRPGGSTPSRLASVEVLDEDTLKP
jgi:hypothetical protein